MEVEPIPYASASVAPANAYQICVMSLRLMAIYFVVGDFGEIGFVLASLLTPGQYLPKVEVVTISSIAVLQILTAMALWFAAHWLSRHIVPRSLVYELPISGSVLHSIGFSILGGYFVFTGILRLLEMETMNIALRGALIGPIAEIAIGAVCFLEGKFFVRLWHRLRDPGFANRG